MGTIFPRDFPNARNKKWQLLFLNEPIMFMEKLMQTPDKHNIQP
jgi:hypothetical protein